MGAKPQDTMAPADLELTLALVRNGTLAAAGERLGVDASTVFRGLQRIERGLGTALFERTRAGYLANELATELAAHAEQMEVALEAARSAVEAQPARVSGTVRITTTDTVLHGLVAPALRSLGQTHPLLIYELHTGNEQANLTRRDADIAVRATRRPPQHLVGKRLGPLRVALYAARKGGVRDFAAVEAGRAEWIVTRHFLCGRSITMRTTPACASFLNNTSRIFRSSCSKFPYSSRSANQRESHVRLIPRRRPIGLTFCPIRHSPAEHAPRW